MDNNINQEGKAPLYWKPLIISALLLIIDQISKALIEAKMPVLTIIGDRVIYDEVPILGEFLKFTLVYNTGVAFSIGVGLGETVKFLAFIVLPILMMAVLIWSLLVSNRKKIYSNNLQRISVAVIIGGGLGTICDRIFRHDRGVVDFIMVKVYGFLGFEYWPTFNFSDSCVCVGVFFLIISLFLKDTLTVKENA